jgi:beta propeller repeat protein
MKCILYLCSTILLLCIAMPPVAASLSGTDIPIHSPYITEDDSGKPNYTYPEGVAIDRDQMVWEKLIWEPANSSHFSLTLYLMNLTDGNTRIIATSPSQDFQYFFQTPFGFADGRVVWNAENDTNLFMYDDRTEKVSPLTVDGTADLSIQRPNRDPFIFGNRIVWAKQKLYPSEDSDIVLYNLTDRTLRDIATDPGKKAMPTMDDSYVVWVDKRSEPGAGDIYLFDLANNTERPLCTARGVQHYPQVSGNYVVWADLRDGPPAIYLFNLTTGTEYRISDPNYYAAVPYLSGNYVAWEMYALYDDTKEKTRQVVVYNIATGESVLFEPGTRHPMLLGLNNNRILYANPDNQTIKDGYVHIFAIDTPAPDQSTPGVPVAATPQTENKTAPVSYTFSEPASAGSGPVTALVALLPGIGLVMAIRKHRTGRKNR